MDPERAAELRERAKVVMIIMIENELVFSSSIFVVKIGIWPLSALT